MGEAGELSGSPMQPDHGVGWDPAHRDQLFRLLVSAVEEYAIFALDPDGIVLTWNRGAERLQGYAVDEIVGRHFSRFFTPEDVSRGHPQEELRLAALRGKFEEEGWRVRKDGSRFWASVLLTRMDDETGRPRGFAKVIRDLTERRRLDAEQRDRERREREVEQLRRSEEQLRLLADSIPQLAWIADETGAILWYNRQWYDYTGTTPEQMQGWGWQSVHDPDQLPRVVDRFKQAVANGEPWEDTFPLRSRTGEWRWFLSRALPIRGTDGRISRWFGTNTDVTTQVSLARERDRLLKDVEFERGRFEAVIRQMPAAVIIGEAPSGKLVFANRRIEEVWGHPMIDSLSIDEYASWRGFHADGSPYRPEDWPLARAIEKGEVVDDEETRITWPNGEDRTLRLSASPVRGTDGRILAGVVICQDVTEQRAAHRQLAEAEARFRAILDNSPAMIFMKDDDGRYVMVSRAMGQFVGGQPDQIIGKSDFDLFPRQLAEHLRSTDDEIRRTRVPAQMEETLGEQVFLTIKFPVLDGDGHARFVGGISTEITDRKRAESALRKLTDELERTVTQRTQELLAANKELEAFSYSVSHDLRAPLRAIDGFSKALIEDHAAALDADAQELLSDVRLAAQRMASLIDDLLRLSRVTRAPLVRTRVDLTTVARDVVAELRGNDPGRRVEVHIADDLTAEGDASLIRIALQNLLANAWKFTGRQPRPEIWFGAETVDGTRAYYVRDNGAGFDMAYVDKLFVGFQRLHSEAEFPGTGIGLATVQRVFHRLGGRAWATGKPGAGATFYFTLGERGMTS